MEYTKLLSEQMARSKKLKNKKLEGFSLLEVSVALLIFSISVVTVYQLVVSTQISSQSMREKVIAREIANNRYAMLETIDYPVNLGTRSGMIEMAGQEWVWKEDVGAPGNFEKEKGESKIINIGVNENGEFTSNWPKGFFNERIDELI